MIVYVESNFVLELVRLQEGAGECSRLVSLAEERRIRLVVPAFSLAEPFDTVRRASSERQQMGRELERHLRLLGRSASHRAQLENAVAVTAVLVESGRVEVERLHDVLAGLLDVAEVIPITSVTMRSASRVQQEMGLSPQDSVVFTSVLNHARSAAGPKCFLQRDAKDFLTPDVQSLLQQEDCRIITSFAGGLGFVQAGLSA